MLTDKEAPLRHGGEAYGVWPHCTRSSQCNLTQDASYYHKASGRRCYFVTTYVFCNDQLSSTDILLATDIPFILRTVIQSLLPGSPSNLSEEAEFLSKEVRGRMPIQESGSHENDEHCPACNVVVPLQDVTRAVCSNGHHWSKSSNLDLPEQPS